MLRERVGLRWRHRFGATEPMGFACAQTSCEQDLPDDGQISLPVIPGRASWREPGIHNPRQWMLGSHV